MNFTSPLKELEDCLKELNSTPIGRRAFMASLPLLLASCATPKTRYREGDNTGQAASLTPAEEKKMTQEVLPKMRKDYPPVKDPRLQKYIAHLGKKLVHANQLSGRPYQYSFTVVDVPYVNAFALPAGTVFVTAPLIEMADTEAELMGVIGHEVGHIQARHTAERMYTSQKAQKKSWIYALGGGLAGAALGYGIGKLACPPKDRRCLQKATTLGGVTGVSGGLLIQKYAFMQNSQEDEMEADLIGFRTALRTGYNKNEIGSFYQKLLVMEKKAQKKQGGSNLSFLTDAMSTHPPSEKRVQQMKTMANETSQSKKAIVSTKSFEKMKKRASLIAQRARSRARG